MNPVLFAFARRLACAAPLALAAGCVSTTPNYDRHFGAAVRDTLAAQVADPAAGANHDPVRGLDARSARNALERYQKSFSEQQAAPASMTTGGAGGK